MGLRLAPDPISSYYVDLILTHLFEDIKPNPPSKFETEFETDANDSKAQLA